MSLLVKESKNFPPTFLTYFLEMKAVFGRWLKTKELSKK